MTTKIKVIIVSISILTAYAFGRYSAPEKIITETKIVEVEKKHEETKTDSDRDKHKETTTVEKTLPDGSKETTTTVVEDTHSDKKTDKSADSDRNTTTDTKKEVVNSSGRVTISALAGAPITSLGTPVYGGSVTKNILGPIVGGVWALTNGTVGVSLGLQF